MRRIVVVNHITLDGVMQAPAAPDEDSRDGFEYGGWATPYGDQVMGDKMAQNMAGGPGDLLFGRRTYEHMATVWPHMPADNPYTEVINASRKYVASTTLSDPLDWNNSTVLEGEAGDAVARLKAEPGNDIVVLGSGQLVQTLMARDLVDEYLLTIHPLVLGSGRKLFPDGSPYTALDLVDVTPSTTGVLIATYRPGERRPG